ncbi:hypothetical protein [Bacillus sp. B-jedd]|uniref:hypothetical protein n=1 Tax=Bacillus sp. B-jedd TaxID=1476857 RepID=UPI0005155F38|nr:hypothetical protein [Bacillus sp. B-jedd]CEG29599.1 hypothetical protein BN1002_04557 [Bacillus sp. B-jedd]
MKKEVRELIGLALLVEEISDYDVFIHYAGHVDTLEIRIDRSEENGGERIFKSEFKVDNPNRKYAGYSTYAEAKEFLDKCIADSTAI